MVRRTKQSVKIYFAEQEDLDYAEFKSAVSGGVMEISGTQSAASLLDQAKMAQDVGVSVLKKALDIQTSSALSLLQALPPVRSNLPMHLGQNINTTA